jgi:hypothetical protein
MGLTKNESKKLTFVNLSKGKFYTKEKDKEPEYYTDLSGFIVKVEFRMDEFNGQNFEVAEFFVSDAGTMYCLKMRTDSGYFRGFANSLKNGNPKEKFQIVPSYKEQDGKVKTTIFVKQNGNVLKHAHTLGNMGDLPQAEKTTFKGKDIWDSTNQITYWKKFLSNTAWYQEYIEQQTYTKPLFEKTETKEIFEDDLPF